MLVSNLFSVKSASICFSPLPINPFPIVFGGFSGDTVFKCMDYSSGLSAVIAGGTSASSDLVTTSPSPILALFSASTGVVTPMMKYFYIN